MDIKLSSLDCDILSLFRDSYVRRLSLSEIAKRLGVHHRSVHIHVAALEEARILRRERKGRFIFVSPWLTERFIRAMILTEIHYFLRDSRVIIHKLSERCRHTAFCIIFGSYAARREHDLSDVDILTSHPLETDDLLVPVQQFVYPSLSRIPSELFAEIRKNHLILTGYEPFVFEMVKHYESREDEVVF